MINDEMIPTEHYRYGVMINEHHTILKMDAGTHHIFNAFRRHAECMATLTETQKREYPLLDAMCAANDITPVGFLYFKNAMLFVLCDGPTYGVAAACEDGAADRAIHRVVCMEMMLVRNADHMITQDPATKCTDPADKDAVIRDLRIEKNGLLCIINSIRGDAEAAHGKIQAALEHRDSERLREARDAIENIIESIGVKP